LYYNAKYFKDKVFIKLKKYKISYILLIITLIGYFSCQREKKQSLSGNVSSASVSIKKTSTGFSMYRNGEPYFIKGVGGYTHLKELKDLGGNSIRVWDTSDADRILDQAQENGLTVMLGIWIGREKEGFNYFDNEAINKLKQQIKADVLQYRNHPALLVWCLGNELENGTANARAWKVINEIAVMVRELDPNHPITMAVNSINPRVIRIIKRDIPAVELLSFNIYAGLASLDEQLKEADWGGPYIISEYSSKGYWESASTSWKAPIEYNSSEKSAFIGNLYKKYIQNNPPNCLGSYAFYWGSKQECTPTWFSILDENGRKSAVADMLQNVWTGQWPANKAPAIVNISLTQQNNTPVKEISAGEIYFAHVNAKDFEGDSLTYKWEVLPESNWKELDGSVDKETKPMAVKNVLLQNQGATVKIKSPLKPGPYRLFVYVYDEKESFGTANIPFFVDGEKKNVNVISKAFVYVNNRK